MREYAAEKATAGTIHGGRHVKAFVACFAEILVANAELLDRFSNRLFESMISLAIGKHIVKHFCLPGSGSQVDCIRNRIWRTIVAGMARSYGESSGIGMVRDIVGAVHGRENLNRSKCDCPGLFIDNPVLEA
jgi:hypothetical protein